MQAPVHLTKWLQKSGNLKGRLSRKTRSLFTEDSSNQIISVTAAGVKGKAYFCIPTMPPIDVTETIWRICADRSS